MEIIKFCIWNYKSIRDLGDCYPTGNVTTFAGKNESGKTSILEALENFNVGMDLSADAVPIDAKDDVKPKVAITFRVLGDEIKKIYDRLNLVPVGQFPEFLDITIEKQYPEKYILDETIWAKLPKVGPNKADIERLISALSAGKKKLSEATTDQALIQQYSNTLDTSTVSKVLNDVDDLNRAKDIISSNVNLIRPRDSLTAEFATLLDQLIETLAKYYFSTKSISVRETSFQEEFLNSIPHFILFNSFEDVFPNTIPLKELDENAWIADLEVISDIDVDMINSKNQRGKKKHKEELNIRLNRDYEKFWHQDLSRLSIDWDNEELQFWIVENGEFYAPKQRSQGKRWHLAFYIRVTARAREDTQNIILIDEPGLYLHANAQKEILLHLAELAQGSQIFFSTHSPYLLEADRLERIRLVQKTDDAGTTIENKLHKISDKETLTPILTAIGLGLNDGIDHVERLNNVICEGPSDYYYLNAFKEKTKKQNINFIYGGGSSRMQYVGTILQGWGAHVIYLFDNDQGFKDATKDLKRNWVIADEKLLTKIGIQDGSIEDVLSHDDYAKHVVNEEPGAVGAKNSEYAAENRDKVLDAKLFREAVEKLEDELSAETLDNIKNLFDKFDSLFKENYPD